MIKNDTTSLGRQIISLSAPMAAQNLVNFAVNMTGTMMLGLFGEAELSAASLANQLFFIVTLVVYGIGGGANVLVAQHWGKRDMQSIYRVLAYTYRLAAGFALLVSALALCVPTQIMQLFTSDAEIIAMGASYLRIVALSYVFYTATAITTCVLRAVRTVSVAMWLSICSLTVSGGLSYLLIFGKLGFPAMGIRGAAVAVLAARAAEFVLLLVYVIFFEKKLQLRLKKLIPLDRSLQKDFYSTSVPVILNELFWALGDAVIAMILGHMGREVVSATSIYSTASQLACVVLSGTSASACVIISNTIGAGRLEELPKLRRLFARLSVAVGLFGSAMVLLLTPIFIRSYNVSELAKSYAWQILCVGVVIEFFRALQTMRMMGVLRGGGDVRFAMMNDLIFQWMFVIPLGFVASNLLSLSVPVVYLILKSDQIIKVFTSEWRLRSGRWVHNLTQQSSG